MAKKHIKKCINFTKKNLIHLVQPSPGRFFNPSLLGLNLCQLFTYAAPITTLIEPNQMILAILID